MLVGSFPPESSWVGALDMVGNVAEWTSENRLGYGVVKGGHWNDFNSPANLTAEEPRIRGLSFFNNMVGFRCVRFVDEGVP